MKTLTLRSIFLSTSSSTSRFPHFLSSHYLFFHSSIIEEPQSKRRSVTSPSSSSSSFSSSSSWRHHNEESRNIKVSVWWDFENCSVPSGVNVFGVTQRITSALRANGIKGPVTITAFGDVFQLSRSNQEALSSTGICLNHVPQGGKNSADRSLLVDLVCWVSQNPPPAHLFLISGDRDFANILHRLRMKNYNILLASSDFAPSVLYSAASIVWHWNSLVRGDSLSGKHFNQPPDGSYGSWYGHYKGPLEDPFSDIGNPTCLQAEDSTESGTDPKPRPIPKVLVNRIRQILNSYPKGVSITDLRYELRRSNVAMDKDFFGHKKFSSLLVSLPTVLKLKPIGDGQFLVHGIQEKVVETDESDLRLSTYSENNNRERGPTETEELNGGNNAIAANVNGKSFSTGPPTTKEAPSPLGPKEINAYPTRGQTTPLQHHDSTNVNGKSYPTRGQTTPLKHHDSTNVNRKSSLPAASTAKGVPSPLGPKEIDSHPTEGQTTSLKHHESVSEVGIFQRMWRTWFDRKRGDSNERSDGTPENFSIRADSFEKTKSKEQSVESNPVGFSSLGKENKRESVQEERTAINSEENDDKSVPSTGFLNQIVRWCRSWRASPIPYNSEQYNEEMNQKNDPTENHELFSKASFWNDLESFVQTPKGSAVISQSRTREQIGQGLQKEGPSALNSLSASALLHLIDLLISEKKWVEESLSQTFPFKLIHPARAQTSKCNSRSSNGLSSLFSGTSSQSYRNERENGDQNRAQIAVTAESTNKLPGKSRSEILSDCQKFVGEIVEEYPQGFNLGSFKFAFLERYGYDLDHQKLGYQKLTTLLRTTAGIKIEHSYILPTEKVAQDSQIGSVVPYNLEKNGTETNDSSSLWEELGPVSDTNSKRNEEVTKGMVFYDNSNLSDEEFSDSEGESPISDGLEGQGKSGRNEQGSSLIQILDSWYSSKDDKGSRYQSHNVDKFVDCTQNDSKRSASSEVGVDSTLISEDGRKRKSRKNYMFVSDTEEKEKEKLVDSILSSLNKSSDSRMQN